ncbi:MAG: hypothetical protein NC900_00070 [Candidatus Omnitrophica bacterium]|nr:hypothetical protein [Candidatus Omnitrophota bacterium]
MAVAKILKIYILGLDNIKDKLLDYLQEKGSIELIKTSIEKESSNIDSSEIDSYLKLISSILKFLYSLQRKRELFLKERNIIDWQEWQKITSSYDYKKIVSDINYLKKNLEEIYQLKYKLKEEYNLIYNYKNLDVSLEEISSLKSVYFYTGKIKKKNFFILLKKIKGLNLNCFLEDLAEDRKFFFTIIIFLKKDTSYLEELLKEVGFEKEVVFLKNYKISARIVQIEEKLKRIEEEASSIKEKLKNYLSQIRNLEIIFDYLFNLKKKILANQILSYTQTTFILEGWVKRKEALKLKEDLERNFNVAVYLNHPLPQEDVPVILENKLPFSPFEVVTKLYGLPVYRGIDPTSYLALFFSLSFALCLTDAGYGLILSLVSFYILRKFRLSASIKRFMQLFFIGGIFTIFVGALTGGWFGNLLDKFAPFKKIKDSFVFFDPLKDPLKFLILVLLLGYIQISFGIFLKLLKLLRDKDYFGLLFKGLPTFLIQISLFLLFLNFMKLIPKGTLNFSLFIFILSAILIILYQFKIQKGLGSKLFWSIFDLYSIVTGNFLADTLSFTRLFALGLTTGLLATAINEILSILVNILNSLKVNFIIVGFFAILFFVFGHILNLAINLLGAYVHTSRLQYLEYFSKFFEGGGREFNPFRKEYFYTELVKGKED